MPSTNNRLEEQRPEARVAHAYARWKTAGVMNLKLFE